MGVQIDETTDQLPGDAPVSGAAAPKKPETYETPGLPDSSAFYDSVLALPEEQRNKVLETMHPEDLKGYLRHLDMKQMPQAGTVGVGTTAPAPAAAQPGAQGTPKTATPDLVPLSTGTQTTPQGETFTEVPLTKPDGSPAVGHLDRALAENFGTTPESKAGYYAKNYPDLDFKVQDGRVYVKPKGRAAVWSAVDPNNNPLEGGALMGSGGKEFLQDAADNAYNLAAAVPTGLATAAGGIGGASVAGWPGAMAVGGAAGGLAGGGLEAARPAIRRALGIEQPVDQGAVTGAAAAGAASPLLFGTGAGEGGLLGKAIGGKSILGEGGAVAPSTQRSVLGKFFDTVGPKAGSFLGSIPERDVRFARDNLPALKHLEGQGQAGVDRMIADAQDAVTTTLKNGRQALAGQIASMIDRTGTQVDLSDVKEPMRRAIADLEGKSDLHEGERALLDALKEQYRAVFVKKPQGPAAAAIQQEIQNNARMLADAEASGADEFTINNLHARAAQLFGKLQHGTEVPDLVSAKDAMRVRWALQDAAKYTSQAKPQGRFDVTNVEKGVRGAADGAYGALNEAIDDAVAQAGAGKKGAFRDLNRQYKTWKDLEAVLSPFSGDDMKDADRVGKVMRNLGAKGNAATRARLEQIDKQFAQPGREIVKNADLLNALAVFSDPSNVALNGWGSTATAKTNQGKALGEAVGALAGGLGGYFAGGGAGADELADVLKGAAGGATGVGVGARVGGFVGQKASTPAALRRYMEIGNGFRRVGNGIVNPLGQVLPLRLPQSLSPWAGRYIEEQNAQGQ